MADNVHPQLAPRHAPCAVFAHALEQAHRDYGATDSAVSEVPSVQSSVIRGVLDAGERARPGEIDSLPTEIDVVGEGDLQEHTTGLHELSLHAHAPVGIVEPLRPEHFDGVIVTMDHSSGRGSLGDELGVGGG